MNAKTGKGLWGAMAGVAALLVLALAVPVAAKMRFHLRVARERRAAETAMAGIAARMPPAFDPEVAEAARRYRFHGTFPFGSRFSNSIEPPTEGECAAIRAWCATNPEAVALFERLSAPTSAAPAAVAGPVDEAALSRQRYWLRLDLPLFADALLEEAVARGDAASAEDLDRRLRALGLLASDLSGLGNGEALRFGSFSLTLPLFSNDYLDEIDRFARDRLEQPGAGITADLPAYLEEVELEDATIEKKNLPLLDDTLVHRFSARIGRDLSRGNHYWLLASLPSLLAELDDIRLHPAPDIGDRLRLLQLNSEEGFVLKWPSHRPPFVKEWRTPVVAEWSIHPERYLQMAIRLHNRFCFERAAIAIERFRRRTDSLPERLEDLPDDLPRMLPTGLLPEYRRGTFRVPGFRRPRSEEEMNRRIKHAEEETDRAFGDPDYEEEGLPELRIRGYMLSISARSLSWIVPSFFESECPFGDEDCYGCVVFGTLAPDDDPEPDTPRKPEPIKLPTDSPEDF